MSCCVKTDYVQLPINKHMLEFLFSASHCPADLASAKVIVDWQSYSKMLKRQCLTYPVSVQRATDHFFGSLAVSQTLYIASVSIELCFFKFLADFICTYVHCT